MAIVDDDIFEDVPEPTAPAVQVEEAYKGVAVDTRRIPVESLLTHIEGSPWTVQYYSQVLTTHSQVNPQQPNLSAIYQQYTEIRELEIKVTSPLQQSMETPSNAMSVNGSAALYPFLIPNHGDMFVADIGNGRKGVFTVVSAERKTILRETCYEINYELVSYLNEHYERDLREKTVKTVYFRKDFLARGQNPMLIAEEAQQVDSLERTAARLVAWYLPKFHLQEQNTLAYRDPSKGWIYDHFLLKTLLWVLGRDAHPLLRDLRVLNCAGIPFMESYTVWDVLREMDEILLPMAVRQTRWESVFLHKQAPTFRGIYHSGVNTFVYPAPTASDDDVVIETDPDNPPSIHPVDLDSCYVFTKAFYDDLEGKSRLEVEVRKALRGEALDVALLLKLAKDSRGWGAKEQFYYIPVLMMLLMVVLRRP